MSKSSYIHFYSGRTALASTVQAQNDADDERKKVVLLVLVLVLVLLLLLLLVLLLLLLLLTFSSVSQGRGGPSEGGWAERRDRRAQNGARRERRSRAWRRGGA